MITTRISFNMNNENNLHQLGINEFSTTEIVDLRQDSIISTLHHACIIKIKERIRRTDESEVSTGYNSARALNLKRSS